MRLPRLNYPYPQHLSKTEVYIKLACIAGDLHVNYTMSSRDFIMSLAHGLRDRQMRAEAAAKFPRKPLRSQIADSSQGGELPSGQIHSEQNQQHLF